MPTIYVTNRAFWIGLMCGICIAIVFQYSLIFHLSRPLGLLHGDAHLVNFILAHWMEQPFTTTLPMFYGFSDSLFFTDHHFVQAVFAFPFYLLTRDIITTSNLVIVSTLVLSYVSMYCFVWYITRHVVASVLSGVLFVLNPFVFARYPDQLILFSLQWVPLIFLTYEKKQYGWFFILLALQLATSLYYSVFLTIVLPFYIGIRSLQQHVSPFAMFRARGGRWGSVVFCMVTVLSALLYFQVFSHDPIGRSREVVALYAAQPIDWLSTSEFNMLYGQLLPRRQNSIYSEHSLFFGVIPSFLFLASGFFIRKKDPWRKFWVAGSLVAGVSVLLSFGPFITFSETLRIPSPYQLLTVINPLFTYIRTAARFAVFFNFFAAWIVALAWVRIESRMSNRWKIAAGVCVIYFVCIEYWNKPLDFFTPPQSFALPYQVLSQREDIKVIVEYPVANRIPYPYSGARTEELDARYLLYRLLYHDKVLWNGYNGFLPAEYYKRADYMSVNFPTTDKLMMFRRWGVDALMLHREECLDLSICDRLKTELQVRNVPIIAEVGDVTLFDFTKIQQAL